MYQPSPHILVPNETFYTTRTIPDIEVSIVPWELGGEAQAVHNLYHKIPFFSWLVAVWYNAGKADISPKCIYKKEV